MSSPPHSDRKPITLSKLAEMRTLGEPIVMVTAYDHPSAVVVEEAGVDVVVGDWAANNVLGYETTVPVTLEELLMLAAASARPAHAAARGRPAVRLLRGLRRAGDRHRTASSRRRAATRSSSRAAARWPSAHAIVNAGVPVMGHVGLTPQTATALGGYRAQGRTAERARAVLDDALELQGGGCFSIVFEAIPADVTDGDHAVHGGPGDRDRRRGASTDGQVLVLHDLLGIHDGHKPKFVKQYADVKGEMVRGVEAYAEDVRTRAFPAREHAYGIAPEELERLRAMLPPHRTAV